MATTAIPGDGGGPREEALAWFRPAIRSKVYRAWGQAFAFVMSGSIALGLLRVERVDFGSPWLVLYIAGILLVMAGPLWLATRLARLMREERVLTIHRRGIQWSVGDHVEAALQWSAIDRVERIEGAIVVDGEAQRLVLPEHFEDMRPEALVSLLQDFRRRALLGLPLRAPTGV